MAAKKSLQKKLQVSSALRDVKLKATSRNVSTKQIIPLGMSPVADRNSFDVDKVINAYIECNDESKRQQMLLDGVLDSVEEDGELVPVTMKKKDASGNVTDYSVWNGVLEPGNKPIVLEHRKKKDGTLYKNVGKPVRPWWQSNLFAIRKADDGSAELCRIQLGGDALENLDPAIIPWFRPCEIVLKDDWTLNLIKDDLEGEKPFIREIEDGKEIESFIGQEELDDVTLIESFIKNLGQIHDKEIPVFSDLGSAQPLDWEDFYCCQVKIKAHNEDGGQTATMADSTTAVEESVICRRYSPHVAEQLADAEGGAYAYVFFRPKLRQGENARIDYILYGALVFEYVQVEPAEEQP